MSRSGLKDAFARYGAVLRNVQWSVSAWAPDGSLVVSLWAHHHRRGADGSAEFSDRFDRWKGPGNAEFRRNVGEAFRRGSPVRLVIASTTETAHVQSGQDASLVRKVFDARTDLVGVVASIEGEQYVFRFQRRTQP